MSIILRIYIEWALPFRLKVEIAMIIMHNNSQGKPLRFFRDIPRRVHRSREGKPVDILWAVIRAITGGANQARR